MLRHFTDAQGVRWRVWDVWPTARTASASLMRDVAVAAFPGQSLADGWLCFECDDEKRRLAPIPPEWETCDDCVLEELCARAGYVTRTPRSSSSIGDFPPDADRVS
jgi:hypothetical protein